jgi:hypothetical protein
MKKIQLTILALGSVCIILFIFIYIRVICTASDDVCISHDSAKLLQYGMSRSEVEAILNCKPGKYTKTMTVGVAMSTCDFENIEWWENEELAIGIVFSDQNTVEIVVVEGRFAIDEKSSIFKRIQAFLGL